MISDEEVTRNDIVTLDDLKQLAGTTAPCITIAVHIPSPFELSARLKNALRNVERTLKHAGVESDHVDTMLEPVRELARVVDIAGVWSNSLIVFRAPEVFRHFLLNRRVHEVELVEDRFHIRPLLSALATEQRFHVLCLSLHNVRLLECTHHRFQEVATSGLVPRHMRQWLNARQPDHVLENRAAAGPSMAEMKGVLFGTSRDRDREDEYLAHFFKEVDEGVNKLLGNDNTRLLLAGVDTEVAAYRRVSRYPRLFPTSVPGSPDGVPDRELHRRAMEVVMQVPSELLEKALTDLEKAGRTARVSTEVPDVVKAAWEGRVADLFVAEDAEVRGSLNEETLDIDWHEPRQDLLNAAAVQTLLHRGRAFSLERKVMPVVADAAAVLRF